MASSLSAAMNLSTVRHCALASPRSFRFPSIWNSSYNPSRGLLSFNLEPVAKTVDIIKAKGGKVTKEPGPVKGGSTVIAFVEDPDGYKFELLERGPSPEPLCQVMLREDDLDRAISFYEKDFGMQLLRKRENPEYKYTIAMMRYGPEDKNAVLELTYNHGVTNYDKGNGYAQIAVGTNDVCKTAEAIKLYGGKIIREPGPHWYQHQDSSLLGS